MPQSFCKFCKKEFYIKPSWLLKGHGKYCSRRCCYQGERGGKEVECFICKISTYKSPQQLRRSKSGKYFCSKSCQTVWRNTIVFIGPRPTNWKDGEHTYRGIMLRSRVPQICKRCGLNDKRVLAVHHIDKNRKNNEVNNLAWLCHNCHFLIHHDKEEWGKFMVPVV